MLDCKRLSPLEKVDGIWKPSTSGCYTNLQYYIVRVMLERKEEKGLFQKLVVNILTNSESNNIAIPSELHSTVEAWNREMHW